MAIKNYTRGPDRGAKLASHKPRALKGSLSFGAAGPVRHIDPETIGPIAAPPPVDPDYFAYCAWAHANGRKPKPLNKWRYRRTRRKARASVKSPALIAHQKRPHQPA